MKKTLLAIAAAILMTVMPAAQAQDRKSVV